MQTCNLNPSICSKSPELSPSRQTKPVRILVQGERCQFQTIVTQGGVVALSRELHLTDDFITGQSSWMSIPP